MSKIEMNLTIPEAAHKLREFAELTANASRNWDAFEEIALSILQRAYEHGAKDR